jgi:hypothetical protein
MQPESSISQPWQVQDRFLDLRSRWMTLIGEHLHDHQGNLLEYWRIEKADSVIVLPIVAEHLLLPAPSYRPGVGQATLDFPGGRVAEGQSPEQAAIATLTRELPIAITAITQLVPLNRTGWPVNSSFSNQHLYGFVAQIDLAYPLTDGGVLSYPTTPTGVQALLQQLDCLQCRAALLEWWVSRLTES